MAELKPTPHPKHVRGHEIPAEGLKVLYPAGKIAVRSRLPLAIATDGATTNVEANVDSVVETKSGELAIWSRAPAGSVELQHIADPPEPPAAAAAAPAEAEPTAEAAPAK
jgi:hypothetical protein